MSRIESLISQIGDENLRKHLRQEVKKLSNQKRFGLVFEDHIPEGTPLYDVPITVGQKVAPKDKPITSIYIVQSKNKEEGTVTCINKDTGDITEFGNNDVVSVAEFGEPIYPYLEEIDRVSTAPDSDLWHTLIEADNYHALQLLEYLYAGKVDCIYIDPPYNTGSKDWKYNNNYVDSSDSYRHSKWLSMMEKRLKLAKRLLNPEESVLICTIDEKEYLHLGCLLEEIFSDCKIQMISTVINPKGVARDYGFSRAEEYIYFVYVGNQKLIPRDEDMLKEVRKKGKEVRWASLQRSGSNSRRFEGPTMFYPIFFNKNDKTLHSVGEPLPLEQDRKTVSCPEGTIAVFPLGSKGDERTWQLSPSTFIERLKKGYVKFGKWNEKKNKCTIKYLSTGVIDKIEAGKLKIIGYDEKQNNVILDKIKTTRPMSIWNKSSHSASEHGSSLTRKILPGQEFPYPKSLYAVYDTIKFFVSNKPNALILDFFAGSGTTQHAVSLLNIADNGKRQCIMVTNNEVSATEEKRLKKQGYQPGDEEWEKLGIAHYVTWPRTVHSIKGNDINGNPLIGDYGYKIEEYVKVKNAKLISKSSGKPLRRTIYKKQKTETYPELTNIKMSDGFKTNAIFFKLGFLDKNSVALGRQFKELLSVLWMKAGAIGSCPTLDDQADTDMLIFPKNRFAVLNDVPSFPEFLKRINKNPDIDVVYIVTDSETGYRKMANQLEVDRTYQLYSDYLLNFQINTRR